MNEGYHPHLEVISYLVVRQTPLDGVVTILLRDGSYGPVLGQDRDSALTIVREWVDRSLLERDQDASLPASCVGDEAVPARHPDRVALTS